MFSHFNDFGNREVPDEALRTNSAPLNLDFFNRESFILQNL